MLCRSFPELAVPATVSSLLLRLLLCASLLSNGIGSATAATRMAVQQAQAAGPAAAAVEATRTAGTATSHCGHGDADDAVDAPAAAPAGTAHHGGMAPGDGDCAQRCLDLCMPHSYVPPGFRAPLAAPGVAAQPVRPDVTGLRSPPSPPPVRPPIA